MNIAQKYVEGLKKAYYDNGGGKQWEDFERIVHGASKENIEKLRTLYPDTPDSLIQLLGIVDGTYWRKYAGEEIIFYFLGSDVEEYPYYLLSAEQMTKKEDFDWLNDYINREFGDDVEIDEKIIDNADNMCWLHFSDCMNNGGTSQLFIDFSPSSIGTKGQIVRYLHDPDEIEVIADSFDEYLQMMMDDGYDFISEDVLED
jgi:hypothetical protein